MMLVIEHSAAICVLFLYSRFGSLRITLSLLLEKISSVTLSSSSSTQNHISDPRRTPLTRTRSASAPMRQFITC